MVSCIILEPKEEEEEEEMTQNLRVGFKEWQRKRLFEALQVAHLPAKRTHLKVSHEELVPDAPMAQMPPSNIAKFGKGLVMSSSAEKDACPTQDRTPVSLPPGNDINDKDAPISFPNQEEMTALLRQVPCFTTPEPPVTSIDFFFPLTRQYFVNLPGDLLIIVVPRLPHGTPKSVLWCIHPMQQYTIIEMMKVVRFASSLLKFT